MIMKIFIAMMKFVPVALQKSIMRNIKILANPWYWNTFSISTKSRPKKLLKRYLT